MNKKKSRIVIEVELQQCICSRQSKYTCLPSQPVCLLAYCILCLYLVLAAPDKADVFLFLIRFWRHGFLSSSLLRLWDWKWSSPSVEGPSPPHKVTWQKQLWPPFQYLARMKTSDAPSLFSDSWISVCIFFSFYKLKEICRRKHQTTYIITKIQKGKCDNRILE